MSPRRGRTLLILLLLFSFAIRAGWGAFQPAQIDPRLGDQTEYLQLAQNLLAGKGLILHDARFDQDVVAWRMPGYPLFVAACGASVRAVRLVQALIDTSTVLAVYLLARRWLAAGVSLLAATSVAVNPFLVYFSALILTETLFTAILVWSLVLLLRDGPTALSVTLSGLLLGVSVYFRPGALGLVILIPAFSGMRCSWRTALSYGGLAGVILIVCILPWAARNRLHPGIKSWVLTTTNSGITTYDGFNDHASGASDQKGFVEDMKPVLSPMSELQRDHWLAQRARQWAAEHPLRSLKLAAIKIGRTWSPIPLSREYGNSRLHLAVALLFSIPLDLLVLLGLWKGGLPRSIKALLLIPAIYFTVLHAVSVGSLRYRIPAEPPMGVIAASGASALVFRNSNASSRRHSR